MQRFKTAHGTIAVRRMLIAGLAACVATLAGCSGTLGADSPEAAAQRARLEIAEEPEEVQPLAELQKQLAADKNRPDAPKTRDVVVVGQIGGMANPWGDSHPDFPWYAGQASFFLVDLKIAEQFANHARSHGGGVDCPFCRRLAERNAHTVAVVDLLDDEGKIIRLDARQLMDLKDEQTVVVRGRAELLGGSMMVIHADGLFVER